MMCAVLIRGAALQAAPPPETEMAARIDRHLAAAWDRENVVPAPPASDAEFLRRAWLDLCGIIPPLNDGDGISGVHDFLHATRPDKRARLIEALLARPRHPAHLANVWKRVMLPADMNVQQFGGDLGFESWLRGRFADNVPYHTLVSEVLLATGAANDAGPLLFYTVLELKPEELAASTSRIFLGVQIQCAQCHDHPFDHWKREDFWGYAAFFARLNRPTGQQPFLTDGNSGEVMLPGTEQLVLPRFLGGEISPDDAGPTRRARLAAVLTSAENPYFTRATVNRAWALLFGRGLVDPVDDLGRHNPPSHPELLDELAEYFVASGFDLRRLLRTLALTEAYQLSSRTSPGTEVRPELFARMAMKTLTAEQLYDCLTEAMRRRELQAGGPQVLAISRGIDPRRESFLARFRAPAQRATEYQAGIPQALTLMNGEIVRQATDVGQGDLLAALEAPFFTHEDRVETVFLSCLARPPEEDERDLFVEYVASGGAKGDPREALGDVLWALLNSAEFVLNH